MIGRLAPGELSTVRDTGPRRRVLIVVNDARFFSTHFEALARGAHAAGADVELALPASADSDGLRARGHVVHDIPLDRRGMNPSAEVQLYRHLRRLYTERAPQVVHHITLKPVLYGTPAARAANVPRVVNSVTGLGYLFVSAGRGQAPVRAAVRAVYRRTFADPRVRVLFENPDDRLLFLRLGVVAPEQTRVVRGAGVDTTRFVPLLSCAADDCGPPVVLLPARMLWDKGVREFAEAARLLRARGVLARFALVGDTDVNRAAVPRAQLEAWTRAGVVEWWGRRDDMPAVLAQATVVALPSYREGCPKALLEAAACGRAIVTSDVPGCREVVTHGDNGLLVPARNANALADALEALLADAPRRTAMGCRGRERAEGEFADTLVVADMLRAYDPYLVLPQSRGVRERASRGAGGGAAA